MSALLSKHQIEWLRQRSEDWERDLTLTDVEAFNKTFQRQLTGLDLYYLLFDLAVDITPDMIYWLRCYTGNGMLYPIDSEHTKGFNHWFYTQYTTPELREKIRECHGMRSVCTHFHYAPQGFDMDAKFKAQQGH